MIQQGSKCVCGDITDAVALMQGGSGTCELDCSGDEDLTCGKRITVAPNCTECTFSGGVEGETFFVDVDPGGSERH